MAAKKKQFLTEKQLEFCRNYEKYGGNVYSLCRIKGYTIGSVNKMLENPRVSEYLSSTSEQARESISKALPYLVEKALSMIGDDKVGDNVKASLINSLLDRGGITAPKSPLINVNINTEISDRARQLLAEKIQTGLPSPEIKSIPEQTGENRGELVKTKGDLT